MEEEEFTLTKTHPLKREPIELEEVARQYPTNAPRRDDVEDSSSESIDLRGVERLHRREITLDLEGDCLIIDGKMIIGYRNRNRIDPGRSQYDELLVTRESTIHIKHDNGSPDPVISIPYPDEEERRGRVNSTFISLRSTRPTVYIGKQYALTFIDVSKRNGKLTFSLASQNPLELEMIDATVNPVALVEKNLKEG